VVSFESFFNQIKQTFSVLRNAARSNIQDGLDNVVSGMDQCLMSKAQRNACGLRNALGIYAGSAAAFCYEFRANLILSHVLPSLTFDICLFHEPNIDRVRL
jgi:hypothetical protein